MLDPKIIYLTNYIFYFNQLIYVNILLHTLIETLFIYKEWFILSFISIISTSYILFSNKSDKILKTIGHIGSDVLMGIGALDSSLNLYDRFKIDESNSNSSSNDTNNENNKDKDKKENKNNYDNKNDNKDVKEEKYIFSGILPFIINIIGKDIPNEADPFITFCFNISILAIIVLICFTNAIAYILTIYFMKIYSLESKFPLFKKLFKYYEKTSLYFILFELIIGYMFLLTIIVICLYSIGIFIK
uniref:Uncharacterized protein n=1 Tax=Amanita muscaria TaxID=41956 RepID=A0A5Q0N337_AMAMU|nr:hypothetical protein [Amanita muscaria]QFZ98629.1 hypothetical protein [Amanita muscaria]